MKAETKEKTVLESNKVIAEFDGWKLRDEPFVNSAGSEFPWWEKFTNIGECIKTYHHDILAGNGRFEFGSYHNSWDWLMPSWRKVIDIIGLFMVTHGHDRLWAEKSSEIDRCITHEVNCLEASVQISRMIKWYNENKGS